MTLGFGIARLQLRMLPRSVTVSNITYAGTSHTFQSFCASCPGIPVVWLGTWLAAATPGQGPACITESLPNLHPHCRSSTCCFSTQHSLRHSLRHMSLLQLKRLMTGWTTPLTHCTTLETEDIVDITLIRCSAKKPWHHAIVQSATGIGNHLQNASHPRTGHHAPTCAPTGHEWPHGMNALMFRYQQIQNLMYYNHQLQK
jgi:hypothetical protein